MARNVDNDRDVMDGESVRPNPLTILTPTAPGHWTLGGAPGSGGGGQGGGLPQIPPSNRPLPPNTVPPPPGTSPVGTVGVPPAAPSLVDTLRRMLTSPDSWAQLATLIPMLMTMRGGGSEDQLANVPEMREAMAMTNARFRRADPLHEAVTQLAFGSLPVHARDGIQLPRVPLPPQT